MNHLPQFPSRQQQLDRDVNTLEVVKDDVQRLQLRLQEASANAFTDEAIDAIADLSNQISDLMSDFDASLTKFVYEAEENDRRIEARHNRSLMHPGA